MRHLFCWDNEALVGRFDEHDGKTSFVYESGATYPISLSLPLGGGWDENAPAAFLDGLLPEDGTSRLRMRQSLGATSTDAFDLLTRIDSSGGLVFTDDERPPCLVAEATIATEADIEAQMQRIYVAQDAWWPDDGRSRFSLAGIQGKFSLARIDKRWY